MTKTTKTTNTFPVLTKAGCISTSRKLVPQVAKEEIAASDGTKRFCWSCGTVHPVENFKGNRDSSKCNDCAAEGFVSRRKPVTGPDGLRECSKCHERKPLSEYHVRSKRYKDGTKAIYSQCSVCHHGATSSWQRRNREKWISSIKLWQERNPQDCYNHSVHSRMQKYKDLGGFYEKVSHFDLHLNWMRHRLDPTKCYYRGVSKGCTGKADGTDHMLPLSRGGSHTVGNIVACCSHDNSSKGQRNVEEYLAYLAEKDRLKSDKPLAGFLPE